MPLRFRGEGLFLNNEGGRHAPERPMKERRFGLKAVGRNVETFPKEAREGVLIRSTKQEKAHYAQ